VDAQGRSWRSGAVVEQRKLRQWFLKVTDFGDRLVDDLDTLTNWPEQVKAQQRAWIGRSTGAVLKFQLPGQAASIDVFTTKPDSLPGVSFLAVAADHTVVSVGVERFKAAGDTTRAEQLIEFVARMARRTALEAETQTTFEAVNTGLVAVHPITGAKVSAAKGSQMVPPTRR
jgi:leucyl-tRNA synthetase